MKYQSAVEFLTTYSWAFLIVGATMAAIFAAVLVPVQNISYPSYCYITASLLCSQASIAVNSISAQFTVVFQNNLGTSMSFPTNAFSVVLVTYSNATFGSCLPKNAAPGAIIICNASLSAKSVAAGEQLSPVFVVRYTLCQPKCASQVYNTTGNAVATAS